MYYSSDKRDLISESISDNMIKVGLINHVFNEYSNYVTFLSVFSAKNVLHRLPC